MNPLKCRGAVFGHRPAWIDTNPVELDNGQCVYCHELIWRDKTLRGEPNNWSAYHHLIEEQP